MSVISYPFGTLSDGRSVTAWELKNDVLSVTILDYGATVQRLLVPGADGRPVDIALGYDTALEYETRTYYLGSSMGRVTNRTGRASFDLNGKTYHLAQNCGIHHLHGGIANFARQIWDAEPIGPYRVRFFRLSPDGEEGYPGNLQVSVTYTLTKDSLIISYDGISDADTPVSLTNHTYFNLNGSGTALGHLLRIDADYITETDADSIPTGRLMPVEGTPFDYRTFKPISRDLDAPHPQLISALGYDHNYVLKHGLMDDMDSVLTAEPSAVLIGDLSGICMTVRTDRPGVQLYTSNTLDPQSGKGGAAYEPRCAVCLETQLFPDAVHHENFPSSILAAGEKLQSVTAWQFSCISDLKDSSVVEQKTSLSPETSAAASMLSQGDIL